MDFTQSSAGFLYAALEGSAINSDSLEENIEIHSDKNSFTWDISSAKGGSESVNPFVASGSTGGSGGSGGNGNASGSGSGSSTASGATSSGVPSTCTPIADSASTTAASATLAGPSGSGCPTKWPAAYSTAWPTSSPPAWVSACYPHGRHGGHRAQPTNPPVLRVKKEKRDDGCPAGYQSSSSSIGTITNDGSSLSESQKHRLVLAHGVLACLAFVAIFPIGGILIRVADFTGLVWIHAALQLVGYLFYIIAFGMGVYLANQLDYMSKAHPIIGIGLFVVLFFQPFLGVLHHRLFKKYGHRTFWSYMHLFHGRIAILLGMVNGGLGIQLTDTASSGARIAYGVIVALVAVTYIVIVVMSELKRRKSGPPEYEQRQKSHQLPDLRGQAQDCHMAT